MKNQNVSNQVREHITTVADKEFARGRGVVDYASD